MKGLLWFIIGFGCGIGTSFLWLHKDVKKELEKSESSEKPVAESDVPFEVGSNNNTEDASKSNSDIPAAVSNKVRVQYHKIIENTSKPSEKPFNDATFSVPVSPREDENNNRGINLSDISDDPFEIDDNTYIHDTSNEKIQLVYYRVDRVLSDENGKIIENPATLIGSHWENWVGHYTKNEAYIRNPRLAIDYDVFVENCSYTDDHDVYDISDLD